MSINSNLRRKDMSMRFGSAEEALGYVKYFSGLGDAISFKKIETEPVGTFGADELIKAGEAPNASPDAVTLAQLLRDEIAAQETYMPVSGEVEHEFKPFQTTGNPEEDTKTKRFHFTISPFRNGVCCWIVDQDTKIANRL